MATRSKSLAAQQRLPVLSSEDQAHPGKHKRPTPPRSSGIERSSATEVESPSQKDNKQTKEQAVESNSLQRSLRSRPSNHNQIITFSAQKVGTRKRSRVTQAEQTTDLRRSKRPRKSAYQPSPPQQPEQKKRYIDTLDTSHKAPTEAPHKRARRGCDEPFVINSANEEEEVSKVDQGQRDPISYWTKHYEWPEGYRKQSDNNMSHLLARQKSSGSLRRRPSALASVDLASAVRTFVAPSSTTPSDQKPREVKSTPYQDPRYETLLATKGSFMDRSASGLQERSKKLCSTLLNSEQALPQDSLFQDDRFEETCRRIRNRNEARVIQDISRLIVPSAESLATCGIAILRDLIESVNEGWNNSIALTGIRPQPDYSVGFRRECFTEAQLNKLAPFIGNFILGDQSYFMATYYMYFPFLTCEVKCGAAALDVADRQNAHSMTLAVRATVELFRLASREMELHQEILAFSISHDYTSVRIYGHYPVIDGKDTKFYRYPIHKFDFTALDGKEKWTAYKFTKNVYEVWMPSHLKRICSAIDQIPADLDFSVPQLSQSFGLSEDLQRHNLLGSSQPSYQSRDHSQQNTGDARITTPNTSFTGQGASKRPRKRLATEGE